MGTQAAVLRDIRKAFLAFSEHNCVVTGRWGCGAFGGTPSHKFVQQIVAARLAGCSINFSTMGQVDGCDAILATLEAAKPTLPILVKAILVASNAVLSRNGKDFQDNFA